MQQALFRQFFVGFHEPFIEFIALDASLMELVDKSWKVAVRDNDTNNAVITLLSPQHESDEVSWTFYQLVLHRFASLKMTCTVRPDVDQPLAKPGNNSKAKDRICIGVSSEGKLQFLLQQECLVINTYEVERADPETKTFVSTKQGLAPFHEMCNRKTYTMTGELVEDLDLDDKTPAELESLLTRPLPNKVIGIGSLRKMAVSIQREV